MMSSILTPRINFTTFHRPRESFILIVTLLAPTLLTTCWPHLWAEIINEIKCVMVWSTKAVASRSELCTVCFCLHCVFLLTMHCVFLHQHMITKQVIQMSSNIKAISPKLDIIATFKTIISILSIKATRLFLSPLCLSIKAKDTLDTFIIIIHHRVYPRTIVVVFIQLQLKAW